MKTHSSMHVVFVFTVQCFLLFLFFFFFFSYCPVLCGNIKDEGVGGLECA